MPRMVKFIRIVMILCFSISSVSANAVQEITLHYSELYNKMKYNGDEAHPNVFVRHYFIAPTTHDVCSWQSAIMFKGKKQERLSPPDDYSLAVPIDSYLRQANPEVTFVMTENIDCDLSVEVLSLDIDTPFYTLHHQFVSLYEQLSGSIGKRFLPDITGLNYYYHDGRKQTFQHPPSAAQREGAMKITASFK
ncbi:DUF2987 domain-containing protein [Thaumasiovibrio sp. DFM-14]|uniref:DUF2987 domain-containing protein n=1 Tax=Thaumasiovibrio sp. DFM-14 TaxID=3384792 RepID=UPI0039A084B9